MLFGTSWGFCILGMICAIPVIWMRIRDTEISDEDFVETKTDPTAAPVNADEIGMVEAAKA